MVDPIKSSKGPPQQKIKQIEARLNEIENVIPRLLSAVGAGLQNAEKQTDARMRPIDLAIGAITMLLGEDVVQAKIDEMAKQKSDEAFDANNAQVSQLLVESKLATTDTVPAQGIVDLLVSSDRGEGRPPLAEQVLVNVRNLDPTMFNVVGAKVGDVVPGAAPGQTAVIRRAFVEVVIEDPTTQGA